MKTNDIHQWGFGLVVLAALCTASCTQETEADIAPSARQAIAFSAQMGKHSSTRVNSGDYNTNWKWNVNDLVNVQKGDETKVYKITSEEGAMSIDDAAPFLWEDAEFTVNAWYPTTSTVNMTDQSTQENLWKCDLLVANNQRVTTANQKLAFSHAVTHVEYESQGYDNYTSEEAQAAKVTFFGYASAAYDATTATWKPADGTSEPNQTISPCGNGLSGHALMLPCEMWDKPMIKVEIAGDSYVYIPKNTDEADMVSGKRANKGILKAGAYQKYYLKVSKQGLTVEMTSSDVEWGGNTDFASDDVADARFKVHVPTEVSGLKDYAITGLETGTNDITDASTGFFITYTEESVGGIDFEGNCTRTREVLADGKIKFTFSNITTDIKVVRMDEYIEVGYYFNKDGSFGSTYHASGDNETVGVVFKVGADANDDFARYAGSGLESKGKIRGYVVALANENGTYTWKDGSENLMSDSYPEYQKVADGGTVGYYGYGNTKYLADKDAQLDNTTLPAVGTATAKNSETITDTSGWYLPSYRQLRDLDVLAGKSIDNFTVLTSGDYWCSTFDNDGPNAFKVGFTDAGAFDNSAHWAAVSTACNVRLILTF